MINEKRLIFIMGFDFEEERLKLIVLLININI